MVCQEDPLEEGTATHPSILAWRILWTESLVGCKESDTTEALEPAHRDTDKNLSAVKHFEEVVDLGQKTDCTTRWF